jgi:carboxylesterase
MLIGLLGAPQGFSCMAVRGLRAEVAAIPADPATGVWRGCEGFGFDGAPGSEAGVVLLHGFLGTPAELKGLAGALHQAGYAVRAVRTPGHACSPEILRSSDRHAWRAAARDAVAFLRRHGAKRVAVVGFSVGGLLAAHAAAETEPDAVVLLAPWNGVTGYGWVPMAPTAAAAWLAPLLPYVPKPAGLGGLSDPSLVPPPHYRHAPLAAVGEIEALRLEVAQQDMPRITSPVLTIIVRHDIVASPDGALELMAGCRAPAQEIEWLERSGHVVDRDVEREAVRRKVLEFLAAHCPR